MRSISGGTFDREGCCECLKLSPEEGLSKVESIDQDNSHSRKVALPKGKHIDGFDYLRILAAFGVVWIHGSDPSALARHLQVYTSFAVPAFIMMSFFLTQKSISQSASPVGWLKMMNKKMTRLIPAYLGWSVLYLLARYLKNVHLLNSRFEFNWLEIILYGGASYQLWFVPALLLWLAVFLPFMSYFSRPRQPELTGGLFVALGAWSFLAAEYVKFLVDISSFNVMFKYMIHQTGYVFCGIGLYFLWNALFRRKRIVLQFVTVILIAHIAADLLGFATMFVPVYSLGVCLLFLLCSSVEKGRTVRKIASISFGIYLCHGLFVEGFQLFARLTGLNTELFIASLLIIVLSFLCSLLLCILLRKVKFAEWLVA